MSETRTIYAAVQTVSPEELHQRYTDGEEQADRAYLLEVLQGLNTQAAGIKQQAAAIRKKLGLPERKP